MKINPDFEKNSRLKNWDLLIEKCENYYSDSNQFPVTPELDKDKIQEFSKRFDFNKPVDFEIAIDHVFNGLSNYQVHTPHTGYFGLYNPRPVFPGIAGDLIAGVFNPQLAAWSHSPFANEVENHLIIEFGKKFGYPENSIDGNFTYGGGESNFTSILCALNHHFPEYSKKGLSGINLKPVMYVSSESHHSFVKAARMSGMGTDSLRTISVDHN